MGRCRATTSAVGSNSRTCRNDQRFQGRAVPVHERHTQFWAGFSRMMGGARIGILVG